MLAKLKSFLNKENYIKNSKSIWNFCTPRCASTYFTLNLESVCKDNKDFNYVKNYFYGKDHPQIIDFNSVFKNIKLDKLNFFERSHISPGRNLFRVISKNHSINIFTRNVYDTIVSMKDYIDKKDRNNNLVMWHTNNYDLTWNNLSENEKYEKIVFFYLPWHIQFLDRWASLKNDYSINFYGYDEIINNPKNIIHKSLEQINFKKEIEIDNFSKIDSKIVVGEKNRGSKLILKSLIGKIETEIKNNLINLKTFKNLIF